MKTSQEKTHSAAKEVNKVLSAITIIKGYKGLALFKLNEKELVRKAAEKHGIDPAGLFKIIKSNIR